MPFDDKLPDNFTRQVLRCRVSVHCPSQLCSIFFLLFHEQHTIKKKKILFIQIRAKILRFLGWHIPHPHTRFYWNPSCSFCVILPTDKQKYNLLGGANKCTSLVHS